MDGEDSEREIMTFPERLVSTCHGNIIFSADQTSYPCSFTTMCCDAPCVRLACNGFVTPAQLRVFRFPFSIFVKHNIKPVFYFACTKKTASMCVSIVLNQYFGECLKVGGFFIFWIRVTSDFLQMVLISVTSRCSKRRCSIFFHTSY